MSRHRRKNLARPVHAAELILKVTLERQAAVQAAATEQVVASIEEDSRDAMRSVWGRPAGSGTGTVGGLMVRMTSHTTSPYDAVESQEAVRFTGRAVAAVRSGLADEHEQMLSEVTA